MVLAIALVMFLVERRVRDGNNAAATPRKSSRSLPRQLLRETGCKLKVA